MNNMGTSKDDLQGKVKKLALGLQELFECPICFGMMDSTLKQCKNGHGVCSSCASKIDKCSICQQELVMFNQNTLLEQVLECIPKPCPNSEKGCNIVLFEEKDEHKDYCEYRLTECRNKFCDWKGCVKDLLDHVKTCQHGKGVCEVSLNVEVTRTYTFHRGVMKQIFTPIVCDNQVFWKCFKFDPFTKFISHKLYFLPTSKPTCNYYMVISFENGLIEFKHTCQAAIDIEDYVDDNGVKIPDLELQHLREPGTEDKYKYYLKLVKDNKYST